MDRQANASKNPEAGKRQDRRVLCVRMPTVEMYADILDLAD